MPPPSDRADLGPADPWIRAVGFGTWLFLGLSRLVQHRNDLAGSRAWVFAWVVYGAAFVGFGFARVPRPGRLALLGVQLAMALLLPFLGFTGYQGLLLAIVAVQVPSVLSLRTALVWTLAQLPLLLVTIASYKTESQMTESAAAYLAFSFFALLLYRLHAQEQQARLDLARANAELLGARAQLADAARQNERVRISRELHDSLGHHLSALGIQLQLASQLASGPAAEPVARAHGISREAMGEVRRVVSRMQDPEELDLVPSLEALAAGIPMPRIHVRASDGFQLRSSNAAHGLFRCVQEAITNSVKHAAARNVWVELAQTPAAIEVRVRDDGQGSAAVVEGNGLAGIRARMAELGGRAEFRPLAGAGFEVALSAPLAAVAP